MFRSSGVKKKNPVQTTSSVAPRRSVDACCSDELSDSADVSSFLPGKLPGLRGWLFPGDSGSALRLRGGMHQATVTLQGSSARLRRLFLPQEECAALNTWPEKSLKIPQKPQKHSIKLFLFLSFFLLCGFDLRSCGSREASPSWISPSLSPSLSPPHAPRLMICDVFSVPFFPPPLWFHLLGGLELRARS